MSTERLTQQEIDAIGDSHLRIGMRIARQVFAQREALGLGHPSAMVALSESELAGICTAAAHTAIEERDVACEGTLEPTWITPERAREIWQARRPAGDFTGACTAHENAEIHRVWETLRGEASWADALLSIAQGCHGRRGSGVA